MSSLQMTVHRWEKQIKRWSDVVDAPEVDLIVAILANAIEDERCRFRGGPKYESGFFEKNAGFYVYCKAIGIRPEFLIEQIHVAAHYQAYGGKR